MWPDAEVAALLPTVSIVFLVYNRCSELRLSLEKMVEQSDYPAEQIELIVVDNASEDGASDLVRKEFPQARLITREVNCGVSGWNDGFAVATGDFILALDDDCFLESDGLRRAVAGALENCADLVSFGVRGYEIPEHRFDYQYRTGLLTFWGCAVLVRRAVIGRLGGYDPNIFVWANEVEFMLRFYDAGFRHLHEPDIIAVHMKHLGGPRWAELVGSPGYAMNAKNLAYSIGKHLRARDAAGALIGLLVTHLRDALRASAPAAVRCVATSFLGFRLGLRHRGPLQKASISRVYRKHFLDFASPWWLSRPPHRFLLALPGAVVRRATGRRRPAREPGQRREYFARGARYYPASASTLEM